MLFRSRVFVCVRVCVCVSPRYIFLRPETVSVQSRGRRVRAELCERPRLNLLGPPPFTCLSHKSPTELLFRAHYRTWPSFSEVFFTLCLSLTLSLCLWSVMTLFYSCFAGENPPPPLAPLPFSSTLPRFQKPHPLYI